MKLSIIIPVFNEEKTIREIIKRVRETDKDIDKEILIVDDGSTDGTTEIVKKIKSKDTKVYFHKINQGKGKAIKTALKHVSGDYVLIQDADLEYDPDDYEKLLKPILKGKAEVVYGSRFTGEHRNLLFWHWVANRLLCFLTNFLYGTTLSDMETGYKVFKTSILKSIAFKAERFDFEPEITARILKSKMYIYEVPISYAGRDYSEGKKITSWDGLIAFWTILRYRFF